MHDDKRLDELRAQRELIRKHLEWLDAQIAEQDDDGSLEPAKPRSVVAAKAEGPSTRQVEPISEQEVTEDSIHDDPAEKAYPGYSAATSNDVLRAKTGCLVFFVLSTLLFLFLLIGLPYLLD